MKKCACGSTGPFGILTSSIDGLNSSCKECVRKRIKKSRDKTGRSKEWRKERLVNPPSDIQALPPVRVSAKKLVTNSIVEFISDRAFQYEIPGKIGRSKPGDGPWWQKAVYVGPAKSTGNSYHRVQLNDGTLIDVPRHRLRPVAIKLPPAIAVKAIPRRLSKNLQVGKAAEYLVAADLILQGFPTFLADQGSPYDLVVEVDGKLRRLQVRSTNGLLNARNQGFVYRFGTRHGKAGREGATRAGSVDYFAFVAMDIKEMAYFRVSDMLTKYGTVVQTMDLKSRRVTYKGRIYSNGRQRNHWGRFFQDYSVFDLKSEDDE